MQIKIKSCPNAMLWYNQHIGEEFHVLREEDKAYWVREREHPYCLNWVYKTDTEVLPKPVVYYDKHWSRTNINLNDQANVFAFNHPRLGCMWVITSTVISVSEHEFETLNTLYKAVTAEEYKAMLKSGTNNA
jgi:hypothetical protein